MNPHADRRVVALPAARRLPASTLATAALAAMGLVSTNCSTGALPTGSSQTVAKLPMAVSRPRTPLDIVVNLKKELDACALLEASTYTESHLTQVFGGTRIHWISSTESDRRGTLSGFDKIQRQQKPGEPLSYQDSSGMVHVILPVMRLPGNFEFGRIVGDDSEIHAYVLMPGSQAGNDIKLEEIVQVFGGEWRELRSADGDRAKSAPNASEARTIQYRTTGRCETSVIVVFTNDTRLERIVVGQTGRPNAAPHDLPFNP